MHQKDLHNNRSVNSMRFDVVIRQDEDGYYVATVPELPGCHTQARSLDELMSRIKEAIQLCLDVEESKEIGSYVDLQAVEVGTDGIHDFGS
jgi:predicted RNase H-like HicB family nuclease